MIFIPGGSITLGSLRFYPEERPERVERIADFFLAEGPVTNAEFARFIEATGYVTTAERALDPDEFPGLTAEQRAPGSLVFTPTDGPVDLRDWRQWWGWQTGACWSAPYGPGSTLEGRGSHPVVQVSFEDATAYADWAGARLPSEAEWERAARGGHEGRDFSWGDELHPDGAVLANTWQGRFPYENTGARGAIGTSPVGTFPPNDYGLFDMIGNVWEWTASEWTPNHADRGAPGAATETREREPQTGCQCAPSAPAQASPQGGTDAGTRTDAGVGGRSRVTKGGSHLCSPDYCQRYRPAARSRQTEDSSTTHLGFRIARSA